LWGRWKAGREDALRRSLPVGFSAGVRRMPEAVVTVPAWAVGTVEAGSMEADRRVAAVDVDRVSARGRVEVLVEEVDGVVPLV